MTATVVLRCAPPVPAASGAIWRKLGSVALTHLLVSQLQAQPGVSVHYKHKVIDLNRPDDGRWGITVEDAETGGKRTAAAKFVLVAAGGGALGRGDGRAADAPPGCRLLAQILAVSPRPQDRWRRTLARYPLSLPGRRLRR